MTARPDHEWWTAAEIAAAGLPDMPGTKRRVNALAEREGWTSRPDLTRRRAGRGGGREYHWSLFPTRAQSWLIASADAAPTAPEKPDRLQAWAAFEQLPEKARITAGARLESGHKPQGWPAEAARRYEGWDQPYLRV